MKVKVSALKALFGEAFTKAFENVDKERRGNRGYALEDDGPGTQYGDLPESIEVTSEENEVEGVDRVNRHLAGYGDDLEEDVPALRVRMHPKQDPRAMLAIPPVDAVDTLSPCDDDMGVEDEEEVDEAPLMLKAIIGQDK